MTTVRGSGVSIASIWSYPVRVGGDLHAAVRDGRYALGEDRLIVAVGVGAEESFDGDLVHERVDRLVAVVGGQGRRLLPDRVDERSAADRALAHTRCLRGGRARGRLTAGRHH